jgi:hypothetical protein
MAAIRSSETPTDFSWTSRRYIRNIELFCHLFKSLSSIIMNNELEGIWKKALISCVKLLPLYLPGGAEENYEKPVRTICVPTETRGGHLPKTSQNISRLSQLSRQEYVQFRL